MRAASQHGANAGPPVVWLTKRAAHSQGWMRMAPGRVADKGEARLTVVVGADSVQRYDKWACRHGIEHWWLQAMERAAGEHAHRWYVSEQPVPRSAWTDVELWAGTGYRRAEGA